MPDRTDVEAQIDRLFALPLADFVQARNAFAMRLKAAGRSADAARVKASAKPSPPAWAVNQLRFAAPEVLAALRAAGDRLRGKAGDRQSAMQARRDALAAARKKIEALLSAGVRAATQDLLRRVSSTLEAVVAYGNASGRPEVGRLTEALSAPGFDEIASLGLLGAGVPRPRLVPPEPRATPAPAQKPHPQARPPTPPRRDVARERALEKKKAREASGLLAARAREAKQARARLQAAEKELGAARKRQAELETALSLAMRLERKQREEVAAARKAVDGANAAELAARGPLKG